MQISEQDTPELLATEILSVSVLKILNTLDSSSVLGSAGTNS